ncbi:hypothetical protein F2Q70_00031160 [Brassica cretica]|uniref:Uncharacterized protein n=1 Tax=Brassica cretica TaxID=69181 RepID=A0A8S9HBC2_BRACR|nr:hypothetical protein F2Q70_00031160 [Brassica cretica]KAF2553288.1 hypothetical protein F2Q68_00035505 [Brassica cretica]
MLGMFEVEYVDCVAYWGELVFLQTSYPAVTRRTVGCRAVTRRTVGRGRLKVPSSSLCGSLGRGVKFVTLTGSSLACHVALPDHGVGLDGQSCSCLIVGWPVGLPSPTLGVGRPSVMFWFDCWPVGRPMSRMVRGCYRGGCWLPLLDCLVSIARLLLVFVGLVDYWDENLKVEGVRGQTQTRSEERRDRFRGVGQWYGLDGWEEQDFVGKGLHQYSGKMKIEKGFEESGQG